MKPEWVDSFRNHTLAFTGKVLVDGDWTIREDCVLMAKQRGALDWKTDMSGKVTLLVYGDLASASVTDKTRGYSKKLALAERLRREGNLIAVIDGPGFSDLCAPPERARPDRIERLRASHVSRPGHRFVAQSLTGATEAVSVTGVGGPGPEEGQPEGTVHISTSGHAGTTSFRHAFNGDPAEVVRLSVIHALQHLKAALLEMRRPGTADTEFDGAGMRKTK